MLPAVAPRALGSTSTPSIAARSEVPEGTEQLLNPPHPLLPRAQQGSAVPSRPLKRVELQAARRLNSHFTLA